MLTTSGLILSLNWHSLISLVSKYWARCVASWKLFRLNAGYMMISVF